MLPSRACHDPWRYSCLCRRRPTVETADFLSPLCDRFSREAKNLSYLVLHQLRSNSPRPIQMRDQLSNILDIANRSRKLFDEGTNRLGKLKCPIFEIAWFCAIFHFGIGIWLFIWSLELRIWDLRLRPRRQLSAQHLRDRQPRLVRFRSPSAIAFLARHSFLQGAQRAALIV